MCIKEGYKFAVRKGDVEGKKCYITATATARPGQGRAGSVDASCPCVKVSSGMHRAEGSDADMGNRSQRSVCLALLW